MKVKYIVEVDYDLSDCFLPIEKVVNLGKYSLENHTTLEGVLEDTIDGTIVNSVNISVEAD
jgi:hypothetical protein